MAGKLILLISLLVAGAITWGTNEAWARDDMSVMMSDKPAVALPPMPPFRPVTSTNIPDNSRPIPDQAHEGKLDMGLMNWIRSNMSLKTGMFLSFQVLPEEKMSVYSEMGEAQAVPGIIERVVVENGLDIYDGAVGQMALTLTGSEDDLTLAQKPVDIYWNGWLGKLENIRAGYPRNNFVYDPKDPEAVSSNLGDKGRRGFIFRIINANGEYLSVDPLDGKTRFEGFPGFPDIHWEDWKPVAGENAWVVMAAIQVYHKKYFDTSSGGYDQHPESAELMLAEELARAAMLLQAENGGVRMAPLGTYRENEPELPLGPGSWWYSHISTENNLSWYSAFRMLYQVTGKEEYLTAMTKMEEFFKEVFDREGQYFYQGMTRTDEGWQVEAEDFAVDVQTWGILSLGADTIDRWFGDGAAYNAWQRARKLSATHDEASRLVGVGYTVETGRVSVEWTAGAIMATRQLAGFYDQKHPEWSAELRRDALEMRAGMELFRRDLPDGRSAYSYSSKRAWIPFGWYSHDPRVLSLTSTGWMLFVDQGYNPFMIDGLKSSAAVLTVKQGE